MAEETQAKAYDFSKLSAKLKARGLDLAEDAAIIVLEETLDWVAESALISKTPFDDIVVVAMPALKKTAMEYVDKIDGKEG